MSDELDKSDKVSDDEVKSAQDEIHRIALQVIDDYLNKSENDVGDKPIEQMEPNDSVTEFF